MRMIRARINFHFLDHGIAKRAFGQHALDRFFQRTTRETLNSAIDSYILEKKVVRTEGQWRVSESTEIERVTGTGLCAAA